MYILIKFLLPCYKGNALHAYFVIRRMLTAVKYSSFWHFGAKKFACNLFALKLACKLQRILRDQVKRRNFAK